MFMVMSTSMTIYGTPAGTWQCGEHCVAEGARSANFGVSSNFELGIHGLPTIVVGSSEEWNLVAQAYITKFSLPAASVAQIVSALESLARNHIGDVLTLTASPLENDGKTNHDSRSAPPVKSQWEQDVSRRADDSRDTAITLNVHLKSSDGASTQHTVSAWDSASARAEARKLVAEHGVDPERAEDIYQRLCITIARQQGSSTMGSFEVDRKQMKIKWEAEKRQNARAAPPPPLASDAQFLSDSGVKLRHASTVCYLRLLRDAMRRDVQGDVIECGVYKGASAAIFAAGLASSGDSRRLWLFDAFEKGIPASSPQLDRLSEVPYYSARQTVVSATQRAGLARERLHVMAGETLDHCTSVMLVVCRILSRHLPDGSRSTRRTRDSCTAAPGLHLLRECAAGTTHMV